SLEYNPRFGILTNKVKYFNHYTINNIPSKTISLGINNIYVILPSFVADLIE
ncbi:hypothetical protein QR685DRAFT_438584, partial [Neurospora intermedia]